MRSLDCLRVVREVRRRREEIAERALAATARELLLLRSRIERLRAGVAEITASRIREIQCVSTAGHHQSHDSRHRALLQQCGEADEEMERLQALRVEQMAAYLEARSAREMACELEERSRAARQAESGLREQRWNEDMFLARKVSNSNTIMHSEDADSSKG